MHDDLLARYTGAFAAVGGGALVAISSLATAEGSCREPLCPLTIFSRSWLSSVGQLIVLLGLMMLAAAGVGLVLMVARQGALRLLGAIPAVVGAVCCAFGFASLLLLIGFSDGLLGGFPEDLALALGILAVFAGLTLISLVLLSVRGLPRAVGACLFSGALLLATTINETTPVGLLSVVSGVFWCGAGALLLLPFPQPPAVVASRNHDAPGG